MAAARRVIPPLIVQPRGTHNATIIFCHGFGATQHDFSFLPSAPTFRPLRTNVKWIFPQAPMRSITISRGAEQPAWFDILRFAREGREQDGDEDETGMMESLATLRALVEEEVAGGIQRERIICGGFSQGAALSVLYASTLGKGTGKEESRVGGLAVLSGYAPLKWKIEKLLEEDAKTIPTFWGHGTYDDVIPFEIATESMEQMRNAGMSAIEFHAYEGMPHSYCDQELKDMGEWLIRRIGPQSDSKL